MAALQGLNGLTPKRAKFTKAVIEQIANDGKINLTQAGLKAFDTTDPKAASVSAARALDDAGVQEQIKQALRSHGLTLDVLSQNLGYYANVRAEKVSADAAIKSNIELLKLMNAYPGQKSSHVSVSLRANLNDMKFQDVKGELGKIDEELKGVMDGDVIKEDPKDEADVA